MTEKRRILLIGEYSGVHTNLAKALKKLGYHVDLTSNKDGFKQIGESTISFPFPPSKYKLLRILRKIIFLVKGCNNYYGYDIVQLIDHNVFGGLSIGYNYHIIKKIKNRSKKIYLSSCGSSYFYYKLKDELNYHTLVEHIMYDQINENSFKGKYNRINNYKVADLVDGIIPSTYSYRIAYKEFKNILPTIPFPFDLDSVDFKLQTFENEKITIMHGLLREGFKGSRYIIPAMERLKQNYPDLVEIVIDGKMPLYEYKKILEKTNILVDQALSYEYGMNALNAMAMGKVVLSGNEPISRNDIGRGDIPVINILPNEDDIYNKLEKLILNKEQIIKIGRESRKFVEEVHDSGLIAKRYLEAWGINHE